MTHLSFSSAARRPLWSLAFISALPVTVWAAEPPDAGLIYKENQPQSQLQPPSSDLQLRLEGQPLTEASSGGPQVTLQGLQFSGNTVYTDQQLRQQLGAINNQSFTLGQLRQLANTISRYYRQHGYPFARTIIPPQKLDGGILKLEVIEGNYGVVAAQSSTPGLADAVKPYLVKLKSGKPISSKEVARPLLLIDDLPGIRSTAVLRPGEQPGTGDLIIKVEPADRVQGSVGVDNQSSRYSGEYRVRANIAVNSVLKFGDEFSFNTSYSNEDTWLGSLGYSLPLGHRGWRVQASYSHTDYQLGHGFEGYEGKAKVSALGVSYPLIRSQQTNLTLAANYQYKDLDDDITSFDYSQGTQSQALPLSVSFSHQDNWLGNGVSWGELTFTPGKIDVDSTEEPSTSYHYSKWNADLFRLQNIVNGFTFYGHLSGQWADRKNLDSSENFYLGGPAAVRAYPIGEGSASRGYLTQLELRYAITETQLQSFVFFDAGYSPNGGIDEDEHRYISGAGLGARLQMEHWQVDATAAWKMSGGDAQSDDKHRTPRFWVSASYLF